MEKEFKIKHEEYRDIAERLLNVLLCRVSSDCKVDTELPELMFCDIERAAEKVKEMGWEWAQW